MAREIVWTKEFLDQWAKDRADGVQATNHPKIKRIEWRDYNSHWQGEYWALIYKKDSYTSLLREQNLLLTKRIMELELQLQLQFQKRRWQALKPEFKCTEETLPSLKYSRYYRNDNE